MKDEIKKQIIEKNRSEKFNIRNNQRKDNGDPIDSRNNLSQGLREMSSPVRVYEGGSSLAELENTIKRVNDGQKQLDNINKINSSLIYRGAIKVYDTVLESFGKKVNRIDDIYQVFQIQQRNIRDLNIILASMTNFYSKDVDTTRNTLDELLVKTSNETQRKKELEEDEIPPEIQKYQKAIDSLNNIKPEESHREYYCALQNIIDAKRTGRKKRFEYNITKTGQKHHKEQIENLMLQEELFETMLYGVAEMAFKTELYQKTLDNNLIIWRPIQNLSNAVTKVSGGINILANFNNELNNTYSNTVSEMFKIINNNSGVNQIENTNEQLRQLVSDVNSISYRDVD